MNSRVWRVGVLGVGRIGRIHATNLARHVTGATLAAIADPQPRLVAEVAEQLGGPRTYLDYRELLASPDVDAIVACTPTATHSQVLMDTAATGRPIFAEKPIDLDLGRIDAILTEVATRGVPMMVGFQRRFDPDFRRVRDAVRNGEIGDVQIVRITSRDAKPPARDFVPLSGGIFLDMTVHDLDVVRFVTGSEIAGVFAHGAVLVDPMFAECRDFDTVAVTLTLTNGAVAVIDNSRRAVYGQDHRLEVFGSKGMVSMSNHIVDRAVVSTATGVHGARLMDFFPERFAAAYRLELQAFVDALRADTPMPVTGHDGRIATVNAMAADRSARENRFITIDG